MMVFCDWSEQAMARLHFTIDALSTSMRCGKDQSWSEGTLRGGRKTLWRDRLTGTHSARVTAPSSWDVGTALKAVMSGARSFMQQGRPHPAQLLSGDGGICDE